MHRVLEIVMTFINFKYQMHLKIEFRTIRKCDSHDVGYIFLLHQKDSFRLQETVKDKTEVLPF